MYEVEGHLVGDEVEEKHEEEVIALCHSGLPLVLCVAAQKGVPLVVKTLLEAKVSPYATDKNGSTALIRICSQQEKKIHEGHYECIELLLGATAEQFYHVRNLQRQNAFDLATRNKQCKTLYYMKPSSYPCTLLGTKKDREKDERKFREHGDWHDWAHDETWASGMSTLMVTLRFASKDVLASRVKTLLGARADVNFKHPKGGSTALHMALVTEDLPEVVELLLKAGADVNAKHAKDNSSIVKDGRTPLLQAAQAGHVEAAKVLIKYEADLFYKRDRSILTYADCRC
jgi:ankyrin repeat protein